MQSTKIDTRNISKPLSDFFLFLSFLVLRAFPVNLKPVSHIKKRVCLLSQSELMDLQAASAVDDNCMLGILFVHLNK